MLNIAGRVIGMGFGSGLSPVAPGTAGSLVAVCLYYLVAVLLPGWALYLLVAAIVVGFPLGVWATGLLCTESEHDPGAAVWDEFVGMWVTCVLLPPTALWLTLAFFAFRFFDIVKPWPANALERLPGGLGIMADDVAAGVYGAVLLYAVYLGWKYWLGG